jgi:hypothetical protein
MMKDVRCVTEKMDMLLYYLERSCLKGKKVITILNHGLGRFHVGVHVTL